MVNDFLDTIRETFDILIGIIVTLFVMACAFVIAAGYYCRRNGIGIPQLPRRPRYAPSGDRWEEPWYGPGGKPRCNPGREEFTRRREPTDIDRAAALLHVTLDAPPEVIEAAWRKLSQSAHPDHGGSEELQRRLNEARLLLVGGRKIR